MELLLGLLTLLTVSGISSMFSPESNSIFRQGECEYGCSLCSPVNGCLSCKPPLHLLVQRRGFFQRSSCVRSCPAGFFAAEKKRARFCLKCPLVGCVKCIDFSVCTSCVPGHSLENGRCVAASLLDLGENKVQEDTVVTFPAKLSRKRNSDDDDVDFSPSQRANEMKKHKTDRMMSERRDDDAGTEKPKKKHRKHSHKRRSKRKRRKRKNKYKKRRRIRTERKKKRKEWHKLQKNANEIKVKALQASFGMKEMEENSLKNTPREENKWAEPPQRGGSSKRTGSVSRGVRFGRDSDRRPRRRCRKRPGQMERREGG